jgi:TolA-binding protein
MLVAVGFAGCAKSGDVEKLQQENRVQDARLKALEEGMADAVLKQIAPLLQRIDELQRAIDGRYTVLNERLDGITDEQGRISADGETNRALIKKDERRFEEHARGLALTLQDQANELDKLRGRLQDLDRLMKSPIAELPASTDADKMYREAHYLMISGQLDLAADKFAQFMQSYASDKRRPEALLRQGQSYFMMRKYDYALAPLYELADKFPNAKAAVEGRWYIARALEETGDLKLARDFYAQLITGKTVFAADATRRVAMIQKMAVTGVPDAVRPVRVPQPEPDSAPNPGDRAKQPVEKPPAPPDPPPAPPKVGEFNAEDPSAGESKAAASKGVDPKASDPKLVTPKAGEKG